MICSPDWYFSIDYSVTIFCIMSSEHGSPTNLAFRFNNEGAQIYFRFQEYRCIYYICSTIVTFLVKLKIHYKY